MKTESIIYNGKNYKEVNKFMGNTDYCLPHYCLMLAELGKEYIPLCNPTVWPNTRIHKIKGKFYQEYLGNQDENHYTI